jgi:hypothetical protein
LLDLVGSELIFFAKRPGLNVVCRDAVFDEDALGAFDAPLGKPLVVFRRAARVRVGNVDGPTEI